MSDLNRLSVRELKQLIAARGLVLEHAPLEKQDLINTLEQANSSGASPNISMSVSELRDLARSLAGRTNQCTEKKDLFELVRTILAGKPCKVCLSAVMADFSERVFRAVCCGECMHTNCAADWVVTADKYPPECPACRQKWDESFIETHVISPKFSSPKTVQKFKILLQSHKELRDAKRRNLSGKEKDELMRLGFRQCPQCNAWIEKGPAMEAFGATIAEGCDKMTCRCGCQFCYRCGSIGAHCNCTGAEHGFFAHRDVIADYPNSNISNPLDFLQKGLFR